MNWLFLFNEAAAVEWVLARGILAVRDGVPIERVSPGDRVALYTTRGAFHNPTRDESQVVALGRVIGACRSGSWSIAGGDFQKAVPFKVEAEVPLRSGMAFRPLVAELTFIEKKHAWSAYLRRSIVALPDWDWARIEAEFTRHSESLA